MSEAQPATLIVKENRGGHLVPHEVLEVMDHPENFRRMALRFARRVVVS